MKDLLLKVTVAVSVVGFIVTLIAFIKPHSDGGKLIRKLCFVNAGFAMRVVDLSDLAHRTNGHLLIALLRHKFEEFGATKRN